MCALFLFAWNKCMHCKNARIPKYSFNLSMKATTAQELWTCCIFATKCPSLLTHKHFFTKQYIHIGIVHFVYLIKYRLISCITLDGFANAVDPLCTSWIDEVAVGYKNIISTPLSIAIINPNGQNKSPVDTTFVGKHIHIFISFGMRSQ